MSNVNPGDLAYVLPRATTPGLAGRFVNVGPCADGVEKFLRADGGIVRVPVPKWEVLAWVCKPATEGCPLPWGPLPHPDGTRKTIDMLERPIADDCLKRVDGPEGMDEMLRITGLPNTVSTSQGEKV